MGRICCAFDHGQGKREAVLEYRLDHDLVIGKPEVVTFGKFDRV